MGKNKCSSKELKSQIEQLESMVQVLKGQMKKDSSKVYRFTEEQMNDVTSSLFDKFLTI
jgi:chaperonin cofactor prefoldin